MSAAEKLDQPHYAAKWVRGNVMESTFGITQEAARKYRERGVWLEGRHWRKDPQGRIVYSPAAIDTWFESGQ
ncbi:DUF1233 family excisionase [Spongiibacter sp. KMU-166]|uniref:DUF1233 family excisionase n=1 Tax=Spongiibacter thalassae TaxID=2721624 RepID=A0ABX1GDX5_9GAMM|nr:excisionase family protein [Spongiibacter thalassae]NKI17387.1 DUF1233 family excisionase [Spongiibacter thalassae]